MVKIILNIEGMSCEHCVKAVNDAVAALPGITSVAVDLDSNTATIEHDPEESPLAMIKSAIEEEGYEVVA
ncbi:MAG: copper ion binding protein [Clostridiales bacterium]|nr:copper ion binding protein [Clostridiales bacterium]